MYYSIFDWLWVPETAKALGKLWAQSIPPKFPVRISEVSMYRMERYFPL